jgi:recombinational DNA repair protein RecT
MKIATVIIGYQGYRNILDRGKSVIDLHPVAVHEGDEFEFELGSRPFIKHKPLLNNRGPLIAVYAVAHLPRGGIQIEVMGKEEVDQHRAKSRASGNGPWVDFYEAMALKTVVRKIAKYLPKSSEILARALDLDDRADRGVDQSLDIEALVFDTAIGGGVPMKQVGGSNLDKLKAQLTAGKTEPEQKQKQDESRDATDEEVQRANESHPTQTNEPPQELLTAEQLRVKREKEEIERKIAEMKAKEAEGSTKAPEPERPRLQSEGGFQPARDALFGDADPNKPIGKEAAQEMLAKIRNAGPKK